VVALVREEKSVFVLRRGGRAVHVRSVIVPVGFGVCFCGGGCGSVGFFAGDVVLDVVGEDGEESWVVFLLQ